MFAFLAGVMTACGTLIPTPALADPDTKQVSK